MSAFRRRRNYVRKNLLFCGIILAAAALCQADTITVGKPGNSTLATPTGPTAVGTSINFDSLAQTNTPAASITVGGATVSSPDGLLVIPYSTMSAPNEVFDNSSNGAANLTVKLATGTNDIGIGIADSDGVSITLQALAANGSALGSAFTENLTSTNDANGNSYFILADTGYDIYGLSIVQSHGSSNYSGLAIDDVQFQPTPEPSAFGLLGAGLALAGGLRLRKKA